MRYHTLTHAYHVDSFLAVILAVIDPFDRQRIAERLARVMKRDAMVAPIGGGLSIAPSKFVIPYMY
jgi:hypothetical protein